MADRRYALLGHVHAASGTAWGGITGTLADQTDLQTALDAKAATSHTHVIADVTDFTDNSTNWDTAFGWGDHGAAGYAALADDEVITGNYTFSGYIKDDLKIQGVADDVGVYGVLEPTGTSTSYPRFGFAVGGPSGDSIVNAAVWMWPDVSSTVKKNMMFEILDQSNTDANTNRIGMVAASSYSRIASSKNTGNTAGQNIEITTQGITSSDYDIKITTATRQVDISGALAVAGNVTGANLNVANWDTAYGWGDHAGLYGTAAAVALNTAKVTNATHTGDVTGSGALTIAAGAVDIAMLANGTDGELITWSAAGAPTTVPVGTATHVLTSNGTGAAPTFQAAAGGGFTPKPVMYVGSGSGAISSTTSWVTVDLATEYYDTETNYSLATDVITVTDAGYYLISYVYTYHPTGGATNDSIKCRMTKNGTTTVLPGSTTQSLIYKSNTRPSQVTGTFLASLAASDTVRLQQACESGTTGTELGTSINVTLVKVG